jgi:hypothetical protein
MAKKSYEVWFRVNPMKPEAGDYALLRKADSPEEAKKIAAKDENKTVQDVIRVEEASEETVHWYFR